MSREQGSGRLGSTGVRSFINRGRSATGEFDQANIAEERLPAGIAGELAFPWGALRHTAGSNQTPRFHVIDSIEARGESHGSRSREPGVAEYKRVLAETGSEPFHGVRPFEVRFAQGHTVVLVKATIAVDVRLLLQVTRLRRIEFSGAPWLLRSGSIRDPIFRHEHRTA